MDSRGEGPGVITDDGCAVAVYAKLPSLGEPELINLRIREEATVLDLGCGTGRIADPLVEMGHLVTAVDNSPEMLAMVRSADTVLSNIEDLHLDQRFDVVLLASHLVNQPEVDVRQRLLAVVAEHLTHEGQALLQWHPPEWFEKWTINETYHSAIGAVTTDFTVHQFDGDLLTASVSYSVGPDTWSQHFSTRRLTVQELTESLRTATLDLKELFGPENSWVEAKTGTA